MLTRVQDDFSLPSVSMKLLRGFNKRWFQKETAPESLGHLTFESTPEVVSFFKLSREGVTSETTPRGLFHF